MSVPLSLSRARLLVPRLDGRASCWSGGASLVGGRGVSAFAVASRLLHSSSAVACSFCGRSWEMVGVKELLVSVARGS